MPAILRSVTFILAWRGRGDNLSTIPVARQETTMTTAPSPAPQSPRFLDRLRTALQGRGQPPERVEACVAWAAAYIRFHGLRHPDTLAEADLGAFLSHLAV